MLYGLIPRDPNAPRVLLVILLLGMALCPPRAAGQDAASPGLDGTVGVQGGRFGIGVASSWPAYGISGTLQVSETLTAEAVLGFFGSVSNFSVRGWYRFNRNESYDLYAYGAVGVYRYRYNLIINSGTESVLGLGAGGGIEGSLQKLFEEEDFPPIFVNAELGLAFASFEYYSGFSALIFGIGIHYRFGD